MGNLKGIREKGKEGKRKEKRASDKALALPFFEGGGLTLAKIG